MRPIPPELLEIITRGRHRRTLEAETSMDSLGLREVDIVAVARSGRLRKKSRDRSLAGRYVWAIIGQDCSGRLCYMAGKVVSRDGEAIWKIITIHEAAR